MALIVSLLVPVVARQVSQVIEHFPDYLADPATPVVVTPSPAGRGWAEAVAALLARRG